MNKNQIKHKVFLYLFSSLFTFTGCIHKTKQVHTTKDIIETEQLHIAKSSTAQITKEKDVITIWVHGTRSSDFVHNYIFKKLLYRKIGLHPAAAYDKEYNRRKIAENLSDQLSTRFVFENFYYFGWSGKLNHKKRKEAAKKLHRSIFELINEYKTEHGVEPKIRLITHSHGGNVALCLSKINTKSQDSIQIYELILLACPVQEKTAHLLKNPMFENIYSLYSGIDILQILDPQGLRLLQKYKPKKPFFSQRKFEPQKNLTQVKIKMNGRGILHVEFLLNKFISSLPHILDEIDAWNKKDMVNPYAYKKNRLLKVCVKNNTVTFNRKLLKTKLVHASDLKDVKPTASS